jgi:hypothetical protein
MENCVRTDNPELNRKITLDEINIAVKNLKNNKSSGNDLILNEMLKIKHNKIEMIILKLFDSIITSGNFPTQWGDGTISSIFKTGDSNDPNNFRGITITSCLSKLFSKILTNRLETFRKNSKTACKEQIAFEKNSRTVDHIFTVQSIIEKYINRKEKIYTAFIDMRKAFDTVLHESILHKLLEIGATGNFYKIIKQMYNKTNISVKISPTERTETFKSEVGIKQGDNLSPTLFKIVLDDLPQTLSTKQVYPVKLNDNELSCLMFADDIILISETAEGLQNAITCTGTYCKSHGLEMNVNKTKVMEISKLGKQNEKFSFNDRKLENVMEYKYLGLTLNSKGNIKSCRKQLYGQALKAMYKLKKCIQGTNINIRTALKLFDTLIEPILLYGCEITNLITIKLNQDTTDGALRNKSEYLFDNVLKLEQEKLHLNYCRQLLGVNNKTANMATLGELGRYPLYIKAIKQVFKFYKRCNNSEPSSLLKNSLNDMKLLINSPKTWMNNINNLAIILNINLDEDISEPSIAFQLKSMFSTYWTNKCKDDIRQGVAKNKLRTFRKFKFIFTYEKYLDCSMPITHRKALTKFRVSNHKLRIETGRYDGTPVELRLCTECKKIEDEAHLLLNCKKFDQERQNLMSIIYESCNNINNLDEENKLIFIMMNENENVIKALGKFVHECFLKM